ncbi:MAG TPA: cyclic nucleotide-binding domain-containing protein [Gammaproteobacteria bacterium]|nr:cyclic nucleotide-binding domain-containing protein [Gammaproteobacteria bacterium]
MSHYLSPAQLQGFTSLRALSTQQYSVLRPQLVIQPFLAGQIVVSPQDSMQIICFLISGDLFYQSEQGDELYIEAGSEESQHALPANTAQHYTLIAATDCAVVLIGRERLARFLTWQQASQDLLLEFEAEGEDVEWLSALLDNPLFSRVPAINIRQMLQRLKCLRLEKGTQLLTQGELGDRCYFLRSGSAQVSQGLEDQEQVVAELLVGACFGEEALLSDLPRNATVKLLTDSQVLYLERADFLELLKTPVTEEVSFAQAGRLLEQGAQWLDVRRLDEYERGHAAQALHMPLDLLRLKARMLNNNTVYLCYCDNGKRSQSAVFLLSQLGFQAYSLSDGVDVLSEMPREAFLCEDGSGYLLRAGGRIERSV